MIHKKKSAVYPDVKIMMLHFSNYEESHSKLSNPLFICR